ncbi:MAG: hypothetical protein ACLFNC_01860 [Halodesulfurarchaeum sp.]
MLAKHADQAYTPKEIHDATGVGRDCVRVVLSRLEDRGLVRHKGDSWAVGEVDDVERKLTSMGTARVVTDRLGAEHPEERGTIDSRTESMTASRELSASSMSRVSSSCWVTPAGLEADFGLQLLRRDLAASSTFTADVMRVRHLYCENVSTGNDDCPAASRSQSAPPSRETSRNLRRWVRLEPFPPR